MFQNGHLFLLLQFPLIHRYKVANWEPDRLLPFVQIAEHGGTFKLYLWQAILLLIMQSRYLICYIRYLISDIRYLIYYIRYLN